MELQKAISSIFAQLTATLRQLSIAEYRAECQSLKNATIGKHVRHIIELFQCLQNGYESGHVNYEQRKRDAAIENDPQLAIDLFKKIHDQLNRPDKELKLEWIYDDVTAFPLFISTNYYREIVYNLEHAIHHMALIRIGIAEVSAVYVPDDFGVAPSTIKHRTECAR